MGSEMCIRDSGIMEDTFVLVERAGLKSVDRINVATRVSNTLKVSAGRMTRAQLSTSEIGDVMEAEKTLITGAVSESAGASNDGSKGGDVLASLDKIGEHITGTVDEEMNKSSNGDETVIALLGAGGKDTRSGKSSAANDEPEEETTKNTDTKTVADADGNGAGAPNTGNQTSNKSSANKGGATSAELKAAQSAIVATDASTGIVALADGTLFDPTYYAAANPDVVAEYGTSTEALLAEWLKEGKAQGRPPIAPKKTENTETKPDWLIRQEQKEREQAQASQSNEEPEQQSSAPSTPSTPGGGGGGGNNSAGVTDNGNGTYTLSLPAGMGTLTLNTSNNSIIVEGDQSMSKPGASVNLPLTINGVEIKRFDQVTFQNAMTMDINAAYGTTNVSANNNGPNASGSVKDNTTNIEYFGTITSETDDEIVLHNSSNSPEPNKFVTVNKNTGNITISI